APGVGISVSVPSGVIRPTSWADGSVNQTAPSGPATRSVGSAATATGPVPDPGSTAVAGIGDSVTAPPGVALPTLSAPGSVNQTSPSGPTARAEAAAWGVGIV